MAGKPDRLHELDAIRDIAARLLAAMETLGDAGVGPGVRPQTQEAPVGGVFLFSSLRERQGTSTIAAAVARALAESGRRTVLALVAKPTGEPESPGGVALKDVVGPSPLVRFEQSSLLVIQVPPRLTELPESAHNPRAWLDGFHVMIIDSPTLTDSLTRYWVPKVQGVVLVLDGEQIAVRAVIQAREDVERLGGRLAGVVLNRYRSRIPRWLEPYFVYG